MAEMEEVQAEPEIPDSQSSQESYATPKSQLPPAGLYERNQGLRQAGDTVSSCSSVVFIQETTRTLPSLVSPARNVPG